MLLKCRCGNKTKNGNMFCSMNCQKAYMSKSFTQNRERKEWQIKNGSLSDFKKQR